MKGVKCRLWFNNYILQCTDDKLLYASVLYMQFIQISGRPSLPILSKTFLSTLYFCPLVVLFFFMAFTTVSKPQKNTKEILFDLFFALVFRNWQVIDTQYLWNEYINTQLNTMWNNFILLVEEMCSGVGSAWV